MDELRWVLAERQRQQQQGAAAETVLPHLLTVLYPTSTCPSWRVPELQRLLRDQLPPLLDLEAAQALAERLDAVTNDPPVSVEDLRYGRLQHLLDCYRPSAAAQCAADLRELIERSAIRSDSVAR